ncbi:MAG: glycosyltransferase [Clostridia bacterium]
MITILCSGSRGDFQPYIALAQQLQKLGKSVRIVGGKSFEDFIKGYGIDFFSLSADYQSTEIDPKLLQDAQSSDNPLKMLLTFNKIKKYVIGLTEEMFYACKGSELIVYHPGCAIGFFAGEKLCIPSILAAPFPMHKTKEVASLIAYGKTKMPKALSYKLLQGMLWMAGKTGIIAFFKKEYGKLPENFGSPFERMDKNHPAIISCSNFVFPRPKDWNANIQQNGYWFMEENIDYTPSKELSDFLAKGEKPVYIGFGSVFDSNHKNETVKLIIDALHKSGKRGIMCGMGAIENLPENLLAINSIPHSWLFERVSLVCHHGGAGTTAAGFKAGIPSIIIPFSNDQFAWAHRAYDLGVSSEPIYRKSLTAGKLASAIQFALKDEIIKNAKTLCKNIATENGAKSCAKIIADCLER